MPTGIWQKIENILADVFQITVEVAAVAAPIVNVTAPGIATLYNLSVTAAMQAEQAATAAAATQTTEAAKLAAIVSAVTPFLNQAATAAGVSAPTLAQIQAYAQAVLNSLAVLSSMQST
jgi:hypothetical protein